MEIAKEVDGEVECFVAHTASLFLSYGVELPIRQQRKNVNDDDISEYKAERLQRVLKPE